MESLDELLAKLWAQYTKLNPQAQAIQQMLTERGEKVVNDHIAFRTFDDPRVDLNVLARAFTHYEAKDSYVFVEKKLQARHYEHPDPKRPRIFISHLELAKCSPGLREVVKRLVDQVPAALTERWDFSASGRPWQISRAEYEQLAKESEYAGWLAAFGFCANHFTVLVNELKTVGSLAELNELVRGMGYSLNTSGGEIKGSPAVLLEQSSTLAAQVPVDFSDGRHTIPSCYYEFARRYPQPDGKLFSGFVEKSADKIFESTDRAKT